MILLGLMFAGFFLVVDFSVDITMFVIVMTVILVCVAFFATLQNPYFRFSKIQFAFVFLALIICVNIRDFTYIYAQPFYLYTLIVVTFFIGFIQPNLKDRRLVLNILLVSSLVISAIVLVSRFLPGAYTVILEQISTKSKDYSKMVMNHGYSGAVAQDIGRTAQYILAGIPILLGRYYACKEKKYLVAIAAWFFSLMMVGRRSELIAAFCAFLLIMYLVANSNRKKIYLIAGCFFVFAFIVLYILIFWEVISYHGDNRMVKSVFLAIHGFDITSGRSRLYKAAIKLFLEHPFLGIGWGGFSKHAKLILPNVSNVHNIYLQLLCEIGIVGTSFFIVTGAYIVSFIYGAFAKHKHDAYCEITTFSMFMCFYILLEGFFDNPIYRDELWLLMSVVIFCAFRFDESAKRDAFVTGGILSL